MRPTARFTRCLALVFCSWLCSPAGPGSVQARPDHLPFLPGTTIDLSPEQKEALAIRFGNLPGQLKGKKLVALLQEGMKISRVIDLLGAPSKTLLCTETRMVEFAYEGCRIEVLHQVGDGVVLHVAFYRTGR